MQNHPDSEYGLNSGINFLINNVSIILHYYLFTFTYRKLQLLSIQFPKETEIHVHCLSIILKQQFSNPSCFNLRIWLTFWIPKNFKSSWITQAKANYKAMTCTPMRRYHINHSLFGLTFSITLPLPRTLLTKNLRLRHGEISNETVQKGYGEK